MDEPQLLLLAAESPVELGLESLVVGEITRAETGLPSPFANEVKYFLAQSNNTALAVVLLSAREPFWSHAITRSHLVTFNDK